MYNYHTIQVRNERNFLFVKLNRGEADNSINTEMVQELLFVFQSSENHESIKVIVLEGNDDCFCTGMDLGAIDKQTFGPDGDKARMDYYELLKCLTISSKVVVARVEGKVNAGGVGLVAASDIVIASEQATFGLSEALFGLLPACVMPFLVRRIGAQKAQWMTLITQGISARRAYEIGLVDEISDDTLESLRRYLLRLVRLNPATVADLKEYMSKLWIISDETKELAVKKISTLMRSKEIQDNIKNFVESGKFPWNA